MRYLLIVAVAVVLLGGALFGGYALAWLEIDPPATFARKVDRKLREILTPEAVQADETQLFRETVFFDLDGRVVRIPRPDFDSGGALMDWSDEELGVIDKQGRIYAITPDGEIARAEIEVPDNGFADYQAALESPEYQGYTFQPHGYRYNDIMRAEGPENVFVYLSSTFFDADEACYVNRLWRAPVAADATLVAAGIAAEDWEVVYDTRPCLPMSSTGAAIDGLRASGRMTTSPDGTEVYLISGDYGLEGVTNESAVATDPTSDYGKILAIDPEAGTRRIVSQGHRNPGGIVFDPEGRLWAVEHGVRGGDELNLIEEGNDYGWPHVSLGTAYNAMPLPDLEENGRHTHYTPPTFAWLPSVGVDALTYVEGFDETWDGDLIAGSLSSEEYGHRLFRIRIQDGRALFAEAILAGGRVRDVLAWRDDTIAVMRDDNRVVLFRKQLRLDPTQELAALLENELGAQAAEETSALLEECGQCHSFTSIAHRAGPSLVRVLGRPVASTDFEGYSDALKAVGGVWDAERIAEYASDPESFAPGSAMPAQPVEETNRDGLIRALQFYDEFNSRQVRYN